MTLLRSTAIMATLVALGVPVGSSTPLSTGSAQPPAATRPAVSTAVRSDPPLRDQVPTTPTAPRAAAHPVPAAPEPAPTPTPAPQSEPAAPPAAEPAASPAPAREAAPAPQDTPDLPVIELRVEPEAPAVGDVVRVHVTATARTGFTEICASGLYEPVEGVELGPACVLYRDPQPSPYTDVIEYRFSTAGVYPFHIQLASARGDSAHASVDVVVGERTEPRGE